MSLQTCTNEELNAMIKGMNRIIKGKRDEHTGICSNLEKEVIDVLYWESVACILKEIFITWPKFSGDSVYPIWCESMHTQTYAFMVTPKWEGQYGEDRLELAVFVRDAFLTERKKRSL